MDLEVPRDRQGSFEPRLVERSALRLRRPVISDQVRDGGLVRNKAVYLGIGATYAGREEVLGLWIERECLNLRV